jgi:hypothetical protein
VVDFKPGAQQRRHYVLRGRASNDAAATGGVGGTPEITLVTVMSIRRLEPRHHQSDGLSLDVRRTWRSGIPTRGSGRLGRLSRFLTTLRSGTRMPCRSRQTLAVPIAAAGWSHRCRRVRTGASVTRTPGGSNGDRSCGRVTLPPRIDVWGL